MPGKGCVFVINVPLALEEVVAPQSVGLAWEHHRAGGTETPRRGIPSLAEWR